MRIGLFYVRSKLPTLQSLAIVFMDGITAILQRVNAGYDDYELRGTMGEWTRDEARAEVQAGIDCQERNRIRDELWSGIWHDPDEAV